ncbi:MAG: hypothetical protein KDA80_06155 [Planctomycetaceae bacterium]|nr:hypothetical protein [Planctomycetaceae bacterium]
MVPTPQRLAHWMAILVFATSLATWQSALGQWAENRKIGPFQLRSEFALSDEQGQELLREMSRLQDDVEQMLGLKTGLDPIEVNLFRTKSSYQNYLKVRVPEGVSRPALFVRGTDMGRVYVYRHWGFEQDLRHECTHAVLHNTMPYVPLWLDEGLAEYFEVPASHRPSGNDHLNSMKKKILFGWKPDLRRLEQLGSLREMDGDDYRESWAWVHFMMHGPPEVRQVLADYLYDIQHGNLAGKLSDRLFAKHPDAPRRLVSHIRQWR